MSRIAQAGTAKRLAEEAGAKAYMSDDNVNGGFSSFSTSSADDWDDRVQYAGGFVSFFSGFLSVSTKKVGIGTDRATVRQC